MGFSNFFFFYCSPGLALSLLPPPPPGFLKYISFASLSSTHLTQQPSRTARHLSWRQQRRWWLRANNRVRKQELLLLNLSNSQCITKYYDYHHLGHVAVVFEHSQQQHHRLRQCSPSSLTIHPLTPSSLASREAHSTSARSTLNSIFAGEHFEFGHDCAEVSCIFYTIKSHVQTHINTQVIVINERTRQREKVEAQNDDSSGLKV